MSSTLLIELLTEELPPKSLARLGETFLSGVEGELRKLGLAAEEGARWYATPRRLAMTLPGVLAQAPDREVEEKLMPVAVALDAAGQPTPALLKKMEGRGIAASELPRCERRIDGRAETLFYRATVKGAQLSAVLPGIVADALKKLPIAKMMRWGDSDHQFVRPVHGLILMHGAEVIPGSVLGLQSGSISRGHRFLSQGEIRIPNAALYEQTLREQGGVVACFEKRKSAIQAALLSATKALGAQLNEDSGLLDEVTALVEWPVVYVGQFDPEFLAVPQECLILTMQLNQKYFPLLDAEGRLTNRFLIVSNMAVSDATNIIEGNQRVVRPRLADARFFFDQDRKQPLASRVARLDSVVYHNKLGSQGDRVRRLVKLAGQIAAALGVSREQAERAALLAKADLASEMVGEFPELQGVMGRYYAQHDQEPVAVSDAIASHYRPRFAGDALAEEGVALSLALADRLDTLTGIFGIGLIPTGDKDPFALRRAALGVLRMLLERQLPLALNDLLEWARAGFADGQIAASVASDLRPFLFDRLRGYLKDQGHAQDAVEAVVSQHPERIDQIPARLEALAAFRQMPEATALAAANKRIRNILRKTEVIDAVQIDAGRFSEAAERDLFAALNVIAPTVESARAHGDYTGALKALAGFKTPVDAFFDGVMVMADDLAVRNNRLALLAALARQMNSVADIGEMA
jgi:glycyl-tRNA synthetase beta chain